MSKKAKHHKKPSTTHNKLRWTIVTISTIALMVFDRHNLVMIVHGVSEATLCAIVVEMLPGI